MESAPGIVLAFILAFVAACGSSPVGDDASLPDDDEALVATATSAGKADGAGLVGLYEAVGSAFTDGDIRHLELRAAPQGASSVAGATYVRERCYGPGCASSVPETDAYRVVRTSSGQRYVQFLSFDVGSPRPVVADAYEARIVVGGITLRRTSSRRRITLLRVTEQKACTRSGGAWSGPPQEPPACDCRPTGALHPFFAPGAGGCIAAIYGTEAQCDATHGLYTDDDATPIGGYCQCGRARHMTEDAGCVPS